MENSTDSQKPESTEVTSSGVTDGSANNGAGAAPAKTVVKAKMVSDNAGNSGPETPQDPPAGS